MMEGFQFNRHHTSEYHLTLLNRSAPVPAKKRILESVPFAHGNYDFSWSNGEVAYEDRQLSYQFLLKEYRYESRKSLETMLSNWLFNVPRQKLIDDGAPGYYFLAECTDISVVDTYHGLEVNIIFDAYPFKVSEYAEGHDLWDKFNFELDHSLTTTFAVSGSKEISLLNASSRSVCPVIVCSAPMDIHNGAGQSFSFPVGRVKDWRFGLKIGENQLVVVGNGTITFEYYKEVV